MPIRICKDCGNEVKDDSVSKKYWCPTCKEVKEDYDERYRICILGKATGLDKGENTFIKALGLKISELGHQVIEININDFYSYIPLYDTQECFQYKKPISLRWIEWKYNPDIIYVEQTYNRYSREDVKCTVIYQHREYTHFPDIDDPDILFGSYPFRLDTYEFYNPYNYHKIKYRDYNLVAVEPKFFSPDRKKVIKGISYIGWAAPFEDFADANGILARSVIEDQQGFMEECRSRGLIKFIEAGKGAGFYIDTLASCEAIIIDSGYVNCFGRTLLEAMASKTLCVIRVHHKAQMDFYKKIGLTDEMCYFIYEPDDIEEVTKFWDENTFKNERELMIKEAYKWVMSNHTYEVRAKETIEKYEEFLAGVEKKPYFMGYAKHVELLGMKDGRLQVLETR